MGAKVITLKSDLLCFWHCTLDEARIAHLKELSGRSNFTVRNRGVSKKKLSWLKEFMEANNIVHIFAENMDFWFFIKENRGHLFYHCLATSEQITKN